MNRVLFSQFSKLISQSRMQNIHIPGSTFVTIQHTNTYVSSPARLFYTSQQLGLALPEKPISASNDYVKVWISRKIVSACMIPVIPWALMYPSKIGDSLLATLIGVHVFFGLGALQKDYVRPQLFGNFLTYVARALVYLVTFAVFGGLIYINQHDIGIANIIRKLWAIKGEAKSSPPSLDVDNCSSPSSSVDIKAEYRRCCH